MTSRNRRRKQRRARRDAGLPRRDFLKVTALTVSADIAAGLPAAAGMAAPPGLQSGPTRIRPVVNGRARSVRVEPRTTLLDLLRGPLGLTGTKSICERGACGACTVILAGKPVASCCVLALETDGLAVTTIEGIDAPLADDAPEGPAPAGRLRNAVVREGGVQCGFCIPGVLVGAEGAGACAAGALPGRCGSRETLADHLCRCGAYPALQRALDGMAVESGGESGGDAGSVPASGSGLPAAGVGGTAGTAGAGEIGGVGGERAAGTARYATDIRERGLLHAALVRTPHARARVRRIDSTAVNEFPGVRAVESLVPDGGEVAGAGMPVAVVVAGDAAVAEDAARQVRVDYEILPHAVALHRPTAFAEPVIAGDPADVFRQAPAKVAGEYRVASAAHACPEPHALVCRWDRRGRLSGSIGAQDTRRRAGSLRRVLDAREVRLRCRHLGGGFGAKLAVDGGHDPLDAVCAQLARRLKRPLRLALTHAAEMEIGGHRPALRAEVRLGLEQDGRLLSWSSRAWGTGERSPLPYLFTPAHVETSHTQVNLDTPATRCFRAPDHPQACLVTMAALDDAAARLEMDPLELVRRNLDLTGPLGPSFRALLELAAGEMNWKEHWTPRGSGTGRERRGLGLALHAWPGRSSRTECDLVEQPDGIIEIRLSTPDIGTGLAAVAVRAAAEALGTPSDCIRVRTGDSAWPDAPPAAGGMTSVGVESAVRQAALSAREARATRGADGKRARRHAPRSFRGVHETTAGAPSAGVQMCEVRVDMGTGVVRLQRTVAVQECGRILDAAGARAQVEGGVIMGLSTALFEERIVDPLTGRMLNADWAHYRIAGAADTGRIEVHLVAGGDDQAARGLAEASVIGTAAAVSNAVAAAVGERVSGLPLTPERVIDAIERSGAA